MAEAFHVGDVLEFTKAAGDVWTRGWGPEQDHSRMSADYLALGTEVLALYRNLENLEHTVKQVQSRALQHGVQADHLLGIDETSLREITGDYEMTLKQCLKLHQVNAIIPLTGSSTGSGWDASAMYLRGQLRRRHNSRIEHLIEPLKRDLMKHFSGSSAQDGLSPSIPVTNLGSMGVPDSVLGNLWASLERHSFQDVHSCATLQKITDCLLFHLEKIDKELKMPLADTQLYLPGTYCLELLKCQLLLDKMKESRYLANLSGKSHWHGYVNALAKALSQQLSRLSLGVVVEGIGRTSFTNEMFEFWPETAEASKLLPSFTASSNSYLRLVEVSLAPESANMIERTIVLFRDPVSDYSFRIVDTKGYQRQLLADVETFNFDFRSATLVPLYAMPALQDDEEVPLEIVLMDKSNPVFHAYRFLQMRDLLHFQQAITGFSVEYMEPKVRATFVSPGDGEPSKKRATVQFWVPHFSGDQSDSGFDGNRQTPDSTRSRHSGLSSRPESILSTGSATQSIFSNSSTTPSVFSDYPASAMTTSTSHSSIFNQDDTVWKDWEKPRVGFREAMFHGKQYRPGLRPRLRPRPLNLMLVLFTRGIDTQEFSIVSITLDENIMPHPEYCHCISKPNDCRISSIGQTKAKAPALRGLASFLQVGPSALNARRTVWDLLSLWGAEEWPGLIRVGLKFPTPGERRKFSGEPCLCRQQTESDIDRCMRRGHTGILGRGREFCRRTKLIMEEQGEGLQLDDISERSSFRPITLEPQQSPVQAEAPQTDDQHSSWGVSDHSNLRGHVNNQQKEPSMPHMNEDLELVDEDLLQCDFELQKDYNGLQSYICTPPPFVTTDKVPITVSGWPVVIPVEAAYPLRALFVRLPDPHPKLIDPRLPLPNEVMEEIFDLYDQALGLYLLIGGCLQIIVPDDFDYDHALSHMPRRFGGLDISYIPQTLTPCAGLINVSDVQQQTIESRSDGILGEPAHTFVARITERPSFSSGTPRAAHANALLRMTSGSAIQAVVSETKTKNRFEGRIGVMTRCRDSSYITIPTHVVTSALLSAKCPTFPGGSWTQQATLVASNGGHRLGSIAETFDPEAGQFPSGFAHDVSLIEVSHLPTEIVSGIKAPIPAVWASRTEWQEAKYSTTKLCLLDEASSLSHRAPVKTIGMLDSQCQAIGEGIFRLQKPKKSIFSALRKSKEKEEGADVWTSLIARSLLFRVHPNCRPPGVQSGSAVCILEEDGNGTMIAKVVGFNAFAQETTAIQSFDTEGPRLHSRLEQGRVAFYGAFQVPSKLRDEHVIA